MVVIVLMVALAGSPDDDATSTRAAVKTADDATLSAQALYVAVDRATYATMVPAGWKPGRASAEPALKDAIALQSTVNPSLRLSLGQLDDDRAAPIERRGLKVLAVLADGTKVDAQRSITFPNKRESWQAIWTAGTTRHLIYVFDLCKRRYLLHGEGPAEAFDRTAGRFDRVVQQVQPKCQGAGA